MLFASGRPKRPSFTRRSKDRNTFTRSGIRVRLTFGNLSVGERGGGGGGGGGVVGRPGFTPARVDVSGPATSADGRWRRWRRWRRWWCRRTRAKGGFPRYPHEPASFATVLVRDYLTTAGVDLSTNTIAGLGIRFQRPHRLLLVRHGVGRKSLRAIQVLNIAPPGDHRGLKSTS